MGGGGSGGFSAGGIGGGSNGGVHGRAPSTGVDEFSDFQGNSAAGSASGAGSGKTDTNGIGGGGGGGGVVLSGISNPKWRDVSSLVDLGGLTSNTDKKVSLFCCCAQ